MCFLHHPKHTHISHLLIETQITAPTRNTHWKLSSRALSLKLFQKTYVYRQEILLYAGDIDFLTKVSVVDNYKIGRNENLLYLAKSLKNKCEPLYNNFIHPKVICSKISMKAGKYIILLMKWLRFVLHYQQSSRNVVYSPSCVKLPRDVTSVNVRPSDSLSVKLVARIQCRFVWSWMN